MDIESKHTFALTIQGFLSKCRELSVAGDSMLFDELARFRVKAPRRKPGAGVSADVSGGEAEQALEDPVFMEPDDFGDTSGFEYDGGQVANVASHAAAPALDASVVTSVSESYADLVRKHVAKFVESARNWAAESSLAARVRAWHDHVEPILKEQEERPTFDMRQYEKSVLLDLDPRGPSATFEHVCSVAARERAVVVEESKGDGHDEDAQDEREGVHPAQWEVCRLFLASLQLANGGQVELKHAPHAQSELDFEAASSEGLTLVAREGGALHPLQALAAASKVGRAVGHQRLAPTRDLEDENLLPAADKKRPKRVHGDAAQEDPPRGRQAFRESAFSNA